MRATAGQEWEMPSAGASDPLVMRITQVMDRIASVQTYLRSRPGVILNRSTMWITDVMDAGILVSGPGSLEANQRRQRAAHHRELLLYAARRARSTGWARDVRFDGSDLVEAVATNEKVSRGEAKAMLRDALALIDGREITSAYDPDEIGYVVPVAAVNAGS
jgi:hypothetical protein